MALWKMGNNLLIRSYWDGAIPCLEKGVRLGSNQPRACQNFGNSYFEKNGLAKAAQEYKKVVEFAPEEERIRYCPATIYRGLGMTEEAQGEMQKFESLSKKAQAT